MVKKFLTIMFASVMAMLAFTAYSNDDEPQGPFGEKMLENIDKIIVDQADAGNLYQKKDDAARFILVADSKEAAHGVCEKFILDQWDGKQRTVKLPDNCGRISLTPGSDESIFLHRFVQCSQEFQRTGHDSRNRSGGIHGRG